MQRLELRERLGSFREDFRFSLRQMRKAPGFAVIAPLTLALGVGATTTIFTVVSGVLLEPLPYAHQERLVQVWSLNAKGHQMAFADPVFDAVAASTAFAAIAEQSGRFTVNLVADGAAVAAKAVYVSRDFFDVFSLEPALGRFFVA